MKVPFSWLKQYVDIDVTAQELEDKLFGCGFEVEELIDLGGEISKVVVGVVTECVPQEGTHLHICKVDCGEYGHDIQISTGAPNVYAGMHTAAALDGSTLPGGVKIKAKPLMGVESNGMLCSGEELGLNEDLIEEISDLQRQVVKMTKEKDEIMAMKVAQLGVYDNTALAEGETKLAEGEQMPAQGEVQTIVDGVVQTADCRFSKLIEVDNFYKTYEPPAYNNDITLSGICEAYRNFACSRMHLYYDIKTIRLFIAGMASTKLIILQGISGTGKTSLPYSFGKFLQKDTTIASVQPSWRDRTELFGYFNEFTKNFNETEVLKRIYSSEYNDDVNFILLDEMNIARVEYYFAEMLSILEMPDPAEWELDLVPNVWSTDPVRLDKGKLRIPQNIWYIGTANNDDSTFTISDKVYDRAQPINLDAKGVAFDAPDTPPMNLSFEHLDTLFKEAFQMYPVSQDSLKKI